jgi:hypothetical protein
MADGSSPVAVTLTDVEMDPGAIDRLLGKLHRDGWDALKGRGRASTPAEVARMTAVLDEVSASIERSGALDGHASRAIQDLRDVAGHLRDLAGIEHQRSADPARPGGIDLAGRGDGRFGSATDQARGAAEARDAGYADPLGGLGPSIRRSGSEGPPNLVGMPSADPRDWARGARGQEGRSVTVVDYRDAPELTKELTKDRDAGVVPNRWVAQGTHPDGHRIVWMRTDGSSTTRTTRTNEDGSSTVTFRHHDADGEQEGEDVTIDLPAPDDLARTLDPNAPAPVAPQSTTTIPPRRGPGKWCWSIPVRRARNSSPQRSACRYVATIS